MDLIDTQWNVNNNTFHSLLCIQTDLIDTQWNVNKRIIVGIVDWSFRFNRYIVECKFTRQHGFLSSSVGFNRYIVECKSRCCVLACVLVRDLIDTQWNVNTVSKRSVYISMVDLIDTQWNVNLFPVQHSLIGSRI